MIKTAARPIHYFLFSQYLADGVRITLEIILPVVFFAQLGKMGTGLTIATGALCVSISDIPGPVDHKRNGMLYCNLFIFLMSLITGLVNDNIFLLGSLIVVSAFFFTMISVYGNRAASIGTAALLLMILRMPDVLSLQVTFLDSLLILAGGIWYMLIALLFFRLTPYRPAQRALGDCIHETAKFLRIKSELYDINTNFEDEYRKLVTQQILVNEKQDIARELLFKNKDILKEPSRTGKLLVLTFADTVDLYEQITATWYDYKALRERFGKTGILKNVSEIINNVADELDQIGLAIQANSAYKKQYDHISALNELKIKIDTLEDRTNNNLVLKKILVNLRNLGEHVDELINYFSLKISEKGRLRSRTDYSKFVSHQEIDFTIFKNNLNLQSGIFRHALRMMITCAAGFVIAKLISYGHHSYWILLTIIIILKPGFSLTKQRNIERIGGTIAGGLAGLLILNFVHDRDILFGFIVFFMLGTYTFQRLNYIVMVIFTTPYILILFNLLGMGFINVAQERLIDTVIASALSFIASYFLFPHWEAIQLDGYMQQVLKANMEYLAKLKAYFSGKPVSTLEYKLARKELYTSTANLSAAFNRMLSEPKSKQRNGKIMYEFVVLNHLLSSNIASLTANNSRSKPEEYPKDIIQLIRRSIYTLEKSLELLEKSDKAKTKEPVLPEVVSSEESTDKHLKDQLDFIYKVTLDIRKATKLIAA